MDINKIFTIIRNNRKDKLTRHMTIGGSRMNYLIVVLVIILFQIIYLSGEIFIVAITRSSKESTYKDKSIKNKEYEWFREYGKEVVQVSEDKLQLVAYEFLYKEKKIHGLYRFMDMERVLLQAAGHRNFFIME